MADHCLGALVLLQNKLARGEQFKGDTAPSGVELSPSSSAMLAVCVFHPGVAKMAALVLRYHIPTVDTMKKEERKGGRKGERKGGTEEGRKAEGAVPIRSSRTPPPSTPQQIHLHLIGQS